MTSVLVLGAGLAGLSCACHLARRGCDVTVLEARDRVGGRVHTLRDFPHGLRAEAGAEFVDGNHRHVLRWARHLGLALDPETLWGEDDEFGEGEDWERFWGSLAELGRQVPRRRGFHLCARARELDRLDLDQWATRQGVGAGSREALACWVETIEGGRLRDLSVLGAAVAQGLVGEKGGAGFHFRDGADALPRALAGEAERLGVRLLTSTAVQEVLESEPRVRVRAGGREFTAEAGVSTLPPRVRPAPGRVTVGTVTKVLVQVDRRVWPTHRPFTHLFCEGLESMWDATHAQSGEAGILLFWISGPAAEDRADWPDERIVEECLEKASHRLPDLRRHVREARVIAWARDPWARGAYSYWAPGFLTEVLPLLLRPQGRLHLAGEHTSPFAGFMEGALESGARAAREVLRTLQR